MSLRLDSQRVSSIEIERREQVLLILGIYLSWLLLSVHPFWRYLSHQNALIAMLIGFVGISLIMFCLGHVNESGRQISAGWLISLFVILSLAFAVLYPISLKHTLNIGSDREDAIRVALNAVHNHHYPYAERTYLGNTITPLPGALYLAAPFFALGHIAWQNFLWFAAFFVFSTHFFRYRATALAFLAIFLLFAPGVLSDFTSGGDYITNFVYFAIAVSFFIWSLRRSLSLSLLAAIFFGITLSSRFVYLIALIPLLALALQRVSRSRVVILFSVTIVTLVVVTTSILAPNALERLAQHLSEQSGKLPQLPAVFHAKVTIPLLALLTSCSAFFVRMTLPRLFLIFSMAGAIMFGTAIGVGAFRDGMPTYEFSYFAGCTLPFALWAFSRFEASQVTATSNRNRMNSLPMDPI